jgi:hypothetical protein
MASVTGTHYNKICISTSCTNQVCVLLYAKTTMNNAVTVTVWICEHKS